MKGPGSLPATRPLNPISSVENPCCNRVLFGVVLALVKVMRRRDFIKGVAVSATWPLAARAQKQGVPLIGFLSSRSEIDSTFSVAAFRQALSEAGYVEGRNVATAYRWADGQYDRLPKLAADLVSRQVAVIVAAGGAAAQAAKAQTTMIPIVILIGEDPVKFGLVASLNKPGGNVTGVSTFNAMVGSKRLELLHELVPNATVVALLVNPKYPSAESETRETQAIARAIGLNLIVLNAGTEHEIDVAFETLVEQRVGALIITGDPLFVSRRDKIVALAARYAVPTIYVQREFAVAGGLIGYGTNLTDGYRQVGMYAGRILKGTKPSDLPVLQPTKFDLVINLKTAKALGLTVPDKLLALADEVIE